MSAATTPVPFFEGSEKRVEIRYLVDDDDAAGVRKIPVDVWSDALRKAGIAIENEMAGADYDCYMLSESSLFVGRTRIICKTCGQSAPLAILDDAIRCAKDFGCEAQHVIFSRSDLLRPSAQDPVHRSFDTERTFLDAVLPHAISSNAYQLGDSASAHWNLYIATLPTESQAAADRVAPTLEIAMYGLDPTTASSVWWADEAGSADVAREVSGLGTVVPGDAIVDEMLFEPCGYSMNAHDPRGALCTVHVTPQPSCSFASFEMAVLDNTNVDDTIRSVVNIFKPARFSVSLTEWGVENTLSELAEPAADAAGLAYTARAQSSQRVACGGSVGRHVFGSYESVVESISQPVETELLGSEDIAPEMARLLSAHGVPTVDATDTQLFERMITDGMDGPFFLADLGAVESQYRLWQAHLPRVKPHYAVKCNPDALLLSTLSTLGCAFDVASEEEIRYALRAGAASEELVFANPVKSESCISYARQHGVAMTTFDSAAELFKISEQWPDAQLLLRLTTDDSAARCELSSKYGAHLGEEVASLILLARSLQLEVIGVSFHCGSGQTNSAAFGQAILDAAQVFAQLRALNFNPHVLDIGGGFPGKDVPGDATFVEIASVINPLLDRHFTEDVSIIAEPGRFFAHGAFSLACNVLGKKAQPPLQLDDAAADDDDGVALMRAEVSYTIGDGLYGAFNSLLYDHASVHPEPLLFDLPPQDAAAAADPARWVPSTVFGPTCDGLDRVCDCVPLPDLTAGRDWLTFAGMGDYTLAAGSSFNGIARPSVYHIYRPPQIRPQRGRGGQESKPLPPRKPAVQAVLTSAKL